MGVMKHKNNILAAITCAIAAVMIAISPAGADTVLYSEGFEDNNGGFTADPGGVEWEWGTPTNVGPSQAHSGTNCWGTNLDGNAPTGESAYGALVSPEITIPEIPDLGSVNVLKIRFWGYVDIDTYAIAQLFISPNNDTQIHVADFYLNMGEGTGLPGEWRLYEFEVPDEYYDYYNGVFGAPSRELEFIFTLTTVEGGKPGFYVDDLAVTVVESADKVLALEASAFASLGGDYPGEYSLQTTFFVYTWDGAGWVMRDGGSIYGYATTPYDETLDFDLSPFLPDPDGEYKVRIWQDFLEGSPVEGPFYPPWGYAAIDRIRFQIGESPGTLDYALDLRYSSSEYPNYEGDGGTYPVKDWVLSSEDERYQIDEWDADPLWQNRWSEYSWYGFSVKKPPTTNPVSVYGSTISWTYSDPESDPQLAYEVEIWTHPGASGRNVWDPPVDEGTAASISYTGDPLPDAVYYVRVRAYDGDGWSGWSEAEWNLLNIPPTANAGPDLTVKEGAPVTLDGSGSTDPDDGIALYQWVQFGGPEVVIENADKAVAGFTAPLFGNLVIPEKLYFRLTVTDFGGMSDDDVCVVSIVDDAPPVADAGADQAKLENRVTALDGTGSTDPDGVIVSYLWEQTLGPAVTIVNPAGVSTTFVTPGYEEGNDVLEFKLTVTDDKSQTGQDTCRVTVIANMPPATPFQTGPEDGAFLNAGEPVSLTSSPYSDPEGDPHAETTWGIRRVDSPTYDYEHVSTVELTEYVTTELPAGLQYSWKVGYKDAGSGEYSWSDEEWTFTVGTFVADASVKIPSGWGIDDYRMVSFTLWPEDPAALSVFGMAPDTKVMRMGTYDPLLKGVGGYIEYGNPNLFITTGASYWILVKGGIKPVIEGIPVSLDVDVDISLCFNPATGNGWNMIAPPNSADYKWDDVEVIERDSTGAVISGPTRIGDLLPDNIIIDRHLWRWESGAYYSDTDELTKNSGYWVKAKKANIWLRFPADAHLASKGIVGFYASEMMQEARKFAGAWGLSPSPAFAAEALEEPPMPMGEFTEKDTAAPSATEGGSGCFIGTTGDER